ncbi:hypothetical protein TWF696_002276 [Orbilia brochopaga]|uniref:Ribosomal protein S11 n=1 Tax=Orbilia brochopaga TaxID=3140254 RepID=A0AAV9U3W8_9PEZI
MASTRSVPLLLRTTRTAATSSTTTSASTICPSCRRPSLAPRWAPISPSTSRRTYADDKSKPSSTSTISQLIKDIAKDTTSSPSIPTFMPSPAPAADASTSIPRQPDTIFGSLGRTSSSGLLPMSGRSARAPTGASAALNALRYRNPGAEFAPGATILDPWHQMFHLNVYSTKHNTHITFSDAKKKPFVSCSTGVLGFRKAARHTYDAAYQLAAHVFQKIEEKGLIPKKVEVILRGFGVGREAFVKALLGKEGRYIKDVVVRVTDGTRTKFGGHRSKNRRRL